MKLSSESKKYLATGIEDEVRRIAREELKEAQDKVSSICNKKDTKKKGSK